MHLTASEATYSPAVMAALVAIIMRANHLRGQADARTLLMLKPSVLWALAVRVYHEDPSVFTCLPATLRMALKPEEHRGIRLGFMLGLQWPPAGVNKPEGT